MGTYDEILAGTRCGQTKAFGRRGSSVVGDLMRLVPSLTVGQAEANEQERPDLTTETRPQSSAMLDLTTLAQDAGPPIYAGQVPLARRIRYLALRSFRALSRTRVEPPLWLRAFCHQGAALRGYFGEDEVRQSVDVNRQTAASGSQQKAAVPPIRIALTAFMIARKCR